MKVAVISTADRCGATVSTLLLGYTIANTQGKTVRICYTGMNNALKRYVGKDLERDATCTISQVSKLLEANAIEPGSLGDYCTPLGSNIDLMDSWDSSLTEEEMTSLLTFTFTRNVADYILCDVAGDLTEPVTQAVLDVCDAVIIVSEPSHTSLARVRSLQESKVWPKDTPCMLLIAKYADAIDSVKSLVKQAQYKMRMSCKLHYNPLIVKLCNTGKLDTILYYIINRDPRVVELNNDLKECLAYLFSIDNTKLKWK